MAKKNYYIGIGGTGARLGEALVHLCAAGLGPEELTFFLIDPDKGNGNLSRTKELVASYVDARSAFRQRAGDDVVVLKTRLNVPGQVVWEVCDTGGVTLERHVGLASLRGQNAPLADLAKVLYSDDELSTRLDEGFRGHPNIGALVISDVPDDKDPWKAFWDDVQNAQHEGEVQVFLAGSIFGGTGAAGIPTLGARGVLKQDRRAGLGGESSKIRLGAGLVLPYFSFAAGQPPEGEPQMFVTAADFPLATKAALHFYAEKDLRFDDVYLLGDSLSQSVGGFSPGARDQKNRPHYIELTGALAALDFYAHPPAPGGAGQTRYFHAAREEPRLDWDSLPVTRDPGDIGPQLARLKQRLAALATFAHATLGYGLGEFGRDPKDIDDVWHSQHFYPKKLFGRDESRHPRLGGGLDRIQKVADYLRRYLAWAAALDLGQGGGTYLFNGEQLQTPEGEVPRPTARPQAIGTFLRDRTENQDFTAFKNVLNGVDVRAQPDASVDNPDVFVNLFYRAARDFAQQNYALAPDPVA